MADAEEAILRRAMILALAACQTLVDQLDEDVLEQLALAVRVNELCDLLRADLDRYVLRNA